jgi:hypothetical protein
MRPCENWATVDCSLRVYTVKHDASKNVNWSILVPYSHSQNQYMNNSILLLHYVVAPHMAAWRCTCLLFIQQPYKQQTLSAYGSCFHQLGLRVRNLQYCDLRVLGWGFVGLGSVLLFRVVHFLPVTVQSCTLQQNLPSPALYADKVCYSYNRRTNRILLQRKASVSRVTACINSIL